MSRKLKSVLRFAIVLLIIGRIQYSKRHEKKSLGMRARKKKLNQLILLILHLMPLTAPMIYIRNQILRRVKKITSMQ